MNSENLILKVFGKGQKERLVPFSPELRKRLYRFEQVKATAHQFFTAPHAIGEPRSHRWRQARV